MTLNASNDIQVSADYQSNDMDKPLLLFVHGFLQTRDFQTVKRLSNALYESGFSTLSPNLSLGISNREQSLSCESIHLHNLNSETKEIAQWVDWAEKKGHKHIVLIGHSAGSVNITHYLATGKNLHSIDKTILISLTYYGPNRNAAFESEKFALKAQKMLKANNTGLETFALGFCKHYVSTAKDYLSYYNWSNQKVINALNTQPENHVIIGASDERIGEKWLKQLKQSNAKVTVIKGANHFFDQAHEFDLLDAVESILE